MRKNKLGKNVGNITTLGSEFHYNFISKKISQKNEKNIVDE